MYKIVIQTELSEVFTYSENDIDAVLEIVSNWLLTSESGETPIESLKVSTY